MERGSGKGKVSTRPHPACRRHDLREPATMPGRLPLISKVKVTLLVTQWCPALYKSMHYGPAGSSVHGILQAGILEWVAVPFSKESSRPRDQTGFPVLQADSLPSEPPGKPQIYLNVLGSSVHVTQRWKPFWNNSNLKNQYSMSLEPLKMHSSFCYYFFPRLNDKISSCAIFNCSECWKHFVRLRTSEFNHKYPHVEGQFNKILWHFLFSLLLLLAFSFTCLPVEEWERVRSICPSPTTLTLMMTFP